MMRKQDAEEKRTEIPLQTHKLKESRPSKREHQTVEYQQLAMARAFQQHDEQWLGKDQGDNDGGRPW